MTGNALPRLGLVITTVGRPALADLLASVTTSSHLPAAVAVANQSGRALGVHPADYPFPVAVVPSSGGVSRGRNDAARALPVPCDVLGFPNDDSWYEQDVLLAVLEAFAGATPPAAVTCRLAEARGDRFRLPPPGSTLDRRTVWRAIEAGTFVRRVDFEAVGGFRCDIGTGAPSAWGSGEGTDLLLRLMARGGRVVSRPDLAVHGVGERRLLDDDRFVAKHRAYARGTGYVYRVHDYSMYARLRTLVGPLLKATTHDERLSLSLRLALARSMGRWEGLTGRTFARRGGAPARPTREGA